MNLPERLTKLRMKKGLTQAALAEQINASRQSISRWELGEVTPSAENLMRLSELYKISIDDLLNCEAPLPKFREEEKKSNEKPAPSPAKSRRGVVALVFILVAILTMAMVIGYYLGKGGDTDEVIPIEKLQEKKAVPSPESEFEFTWEE